MKCPNCASVVPDASNFCGVCGFDMRPAREAAHASQQTMAMNSEAETQAIRAEVERVAANEPEISTDTVMDSAPSIPSEEPHAQPSAVVSQSVPEPQEKIDEPVMAAPESPAFSPDVTTTQGVQINVSPNETFASMEAITPEPGKFRETQWFMAAQDPDHIENIQNVVPTDLDNQYQNSGDPMDTQVRQQFSLNVGQPSSSARAPSTASEFDDHDIPTRGGSNKLIFGIVIALVLAAGAYFALQP